MDATPADRICLFETCWIPLTGPPFVSAVAWEKHYRRDSARYKESSAERTFFSGTSSAEPNRCYRWVMSERDVLSSVNKALTLIELLAENDGLTLTQLATRLGVGKATASRLTSTLCERGWAQRDEDRRFRVGPALLGTSPADRAEQRLTAQLRPDLEFLSQETGETIHLTVLRGRQVVYLDQIVSAKPVHSVSTIGGRSPAHCVSPGLAQLAVLPQDELDWMLAGQYQQYTAQSPASGEEVRRELVEVRARGYAVNRGAFRAEVGGVGRAVVDAHGRPVCALSVCMPVFRMQSTDLAAIGDLLRRATQDAARRVGVTTGVASSAWEKPVVSRRAMA